MFKSMECYSSHVAAFDGEGGERLAGPERKTRRDTQAEETRREIIACARRLFDTNGYAATTVTAIAELAGVSVQTIYNSVGSKAQIVRCLNDVLDEAGGVQDLAARISATTDPVELVELAVVTSRTINESCADIIAIVYSAAASEEEIRVVGEESRRRHRAGIARLTKRLASLGALAPDYSTARAADVLAALTDPQVARTFVHDYGWSWDRWQAWTTQSLATLLLKTR
jgi:AcrR family transcriptional regulator